ncbi:MAG: ABC transporter permease [Proteobacteria bacterium]|nr:ABC transporter permease [Pseudomonadota bacterium]
MEALLEASLRLAAPLLLAALGELIVERSGVVNIGTEGIMLSGAFAGFATGIALGSPAWGVLGAVAGAMSLAAVFAFFVVNRRSDQIVMGMAINLLALGGTGLAARALYEGRVPSGRTLVDWGFGQDVPVLGTLVFGQSPFVAAALAGALLLAFGLARTRAGLRLRAVGESARSADAEGLSVVRIRWLAILCGGALAGLGGAALTLAQSNTFSEGMTAGRGFMALAVVIFGRWNPLGVAGAALFFGAASALQLRLQAEGIGVPYQAALMFPYLMTLVVLLFSAGGRAPGDLGRAYDRASH